jgi:AcrR family transcriptional regulator
MLTEITQVGLALVHSGHVPPRREPPSHRRGAAVRDAVLQATAELLFAEGIANTRMADIAARAGVHETSIYRRWGTRANLIAEALSSQMDADLALPDTGSTREDLIAFFTALAKFLATPLGRSIMALGLSTSEEEAVFEPARDQFWTIRLTRSSILVRRGVDRQELRPEIDAELFLEALGGPLNLHVLLRNRPADRDYVSQLVDLVLDGARPRN